MQQLNQDLSSEMLNYHFVTFVLCVLDPLKHRLTMVNAGHLPPLRRRGSAIEELGDGAAGCRWAATPNAATSRSNCRWNRGDTIVLYTDGISEAMNVRRRRLRLEANARGHLAGARRASSRWARPCWTTCAASCAAALQSDDICLVCFAREE